MINDWIVVANASVAHIYAVTQEKQDREWTLITTLSHPQGRMKGIDLLADGQGHYQSGEAGRGAYSPHTEIKDEEADHFAREITKFLHDHLNQSEFSHLMLAAAPHFYGLLNKHLDKRLKDTVKKTLQKDYAHFTTKELEEAFFGES